MLKYVARSDFIQNNNVLRFSRGPSFHVSGIFVFNSLLTRATKHYDLNILSRFTEECILHALLNAVLERFTLNDPAASRLRQ